MDRVQVIKQESAAGGGDPNDDVPWLQDPIDATEDAIEAAGLFLQSPTAYDENVLISRDSAGNLTFKDVVHTSPVTLTNLLATGGNTIHMGTVDVIIPQNTDSVDGTVSGLPSTPSIVVPALGRDITNTVIDEDFTFQMVVTSLGTSQFNYIVVVNDDGERDAWPGPGPVTVRFDYVWSE